MTVLSATHVPLLNLAATSKYQTIIQRKSHFVRTYSNPNDTVLDFCMGSGTTGVAAQRLGRNFVGIEKEQKYFNGAQTRIESDIYNFDLLETAVSNV